MHRACAWCRRFVIWPIAETTWRRLRWMRASLREECMVLDTELADRDFR
jgi:hypothetical protein